MITPPSESERNDPLPQLPTTSENASIAEPLPSPEADQSVVLGVRLRAICEEIRAELDAVEDPREIRRILQSAPAKIAFAEGKTDLTSNKVESLFPINMSSAIIQVARDEELKLEELIGDRSDSHLEDPEETARVVYNDLTGISSAQPDPEELASVQLEKVPLSKIHGLSKLMSQLEFPSDQCAYKGGVARLALKLWHRSISPNRPHTIDKRKMQKLIKADQNPSDYDIVVKRGLPNDEINRIAEAMGATQDGIEPIDGLDDENIRAYMTSRDQRMNQALLTEDYLYYDKRALAALDKGEAIPAVGNGMTIHARETFTIEDREYYSANTLYRLVKSICEEKADFAELSKYNTDDIPLDRYWLVMARKWINRPNRSELFTNAYSCASQMGQTESSSPAEFLKEQIELYPDFALFADNPPENVAKWIARKYVKMHEKLLRKDLGLKKEEVHFESRDRDSIRISTDAMQIHGDNIQDLETCFQILETMDQEGLEEALRELDSADIKDGANWIHTEDALLAIDQQRELEAHIESQRTKDVA